MVRKQQKWILPDVKAQAVTFDKMYRQLSTNGEAFEALVMELLTGIESSRPWSDPTAGLLDEVSQII